MGYFLIIMERKHVQEFGFIQHSTISIDWQFGWAMSQMSDTFCFCGILFLKLKTCSTRLGVVTRCDGTGYTLDIPEQKHFGQSKASVNQCTCTHSTNMYYLFILPEIVCSHKANCRRTHTERGKMSNRNGKLSCACIRNRNLAFYHRWHVNSVLKIKRQQTNGKKHPNNNKPKKMFLLRLKFAYENMNCIGVRRKNY